MTIPTDERLRLEQERDQWRATALESHANLMRVADALDRAIRERNEAESLLRLALREGLHECNHLRTIANLAQIVMLKYEKGISLAAKKRDL